MQIQISIDPAWHTALTKLAKRNKISLSRLLCESAAGRLSNKERAKLPLAKQRGRPKLTSGTAA